VGQEHGQEEVGDGGDDPVHDEGGHRHVRVDGTDGDGARLALPHGLETKAARMSIACRRIFWAPEGAIGQVAANTVVSDAGQLEFIYEFSCFVCFVSILLRSVCVLSCLAVGRVGLVRPRRLRLHGHANPKRPAQRSTACN